MIEFRRELHDSAVALPWSRLLRQGGILKNSAPHLKRPPTAQSLPLREKQAVAAHKKSAKQSPRMVVDGLSTDPNGRITKFVRDSWMPRGLQEPRCSSPVVARSSSLRTGDHACPPTRLPLLPSQAANGAFRKQGGYTTRPRYDGILLLRAALREVGGPLRMGYREL